MNWLRIGIFWLTFITLTMGMRLAVTTISDRAPIERVAIFLLLLIAAGVMTLAFTRGEP